VIFRKLQSQLKVNLDVLSDMLERDEPLSDARHPEPLFAMHLVLYSLTREAQLDEEISRLEKEKQGTDDPELKQRQETKLTALKEERLLWSCSYDSRPKGWFIMTTTSTASSNEGATPSSGGGFRGWLSSLSRTTPDVQPPATEPRTTPEVSAVPLGSWKLAVRRLLLRNVIAVDFGQDSKIRFSVPAVKVYCVGTGVGRGPPPPYSPDYEFPELIGKKALRDCVEHWNPPEQKPGRAVAGQ
jgi:hypothetical protein